MSKASIGIKLGRAVGYTGAAIAHGAISATKATGRFGEDVLVGTSAGYSEHSARLAAVRAQIAAERPASIAIVVKPRSRATAKA